MQTIIDLFCGRGGWSRAAAAAGFRTIGYDVVDHGYQGELILRPCPLHPGELLDWKPAAVFASPPCEDFARAELPWLRTVTSPSTSLLTWAIDLARILPCPVIVECSRFAARYVPGARFAGSYALWGTLPALLPDVPRRKMKSPGTDPARRAIIEPALADWLIATLPHPGTRTQLCEATLPGF